MSTLEMVVTRKMEVKAELRRVPRPAGKEAGGTAVAMLVARSGDRVAALKAERVQEWLAARPGWRLSPGGQVLQRDTAFPSGEAAACYGAYVASLASSLALPVQARVEGHRVSLSLYSPRRGHRFNPLTEAVLDLGGRIS
jgi:hypothetical protein